MPTSKVVAPVLGIDKSGPTKVIHIKLKIDPKFLLIFTPNSFRFADRLLTAKIPKRINKLSDKLNPMDDTNQPSPECIPKKGGKIRLPAPKKWQKEQILISIFF